MRFRDSQVDRMEVALTEMNRPVRRARSASVHGSLQEDSTTLDYRFSVVAMHSRTLRSRNLYFNIQGAVHLRQFIRTVIRQSRPPEGLAFYRLLFRITELR